MVRIVDTQIFNRNPFRHIADIAEIVLTGIRPTNQARTNRLSTGRHKNTVANKYIPLPGTSIVRAQIYQSIAIDGRVLYRQNPTANGINTHVPKGRVADGSISHPHVRIETGKGTSVIQKIFAII